MNKRNKQLGISLIEMMVVVAVVGILAAVATPSMKSLYNSMVNQSSAKSMIQAALSNARSLAISRQTYAGIRFQRDLEGSQYMIFVINDSNTGAYFFRAVEGKQPLKLPENFGVMSLLDIDDDGSFDNDDFANSEYLTDQVTFSVLFSPQGKLIIHKLYVHNRDGKTQSRVPPYSEDDIFNMEEVVLKGDALFYEDNSNTEDLGYGEEQSRRSFVIYDKNKFERIDVGSRWSEYLSKLEPIYVNAYSGELIKKE